MLVVGGVGVALGINRTFRSKGNESGLLKLLGLIGGIVMLALPTMVVTQQVAAQRITPFTLALMLLVGLSLTSRAMRRIPFAFLIVGALGIVFLLVALHLHSSELGAKLPMTIVAVVLLLILGGVFAASLVVEAVLDLFLAILGWGPLLTVIAAMTAAQGLLIGAGLTGRSGLAELL
jgi:hypothetical protein